MDGALPRRPALGGSGRPLDDRLAVAARLAVQRRQLDVGEAPAGRGPRLAPRRCQHRGGGASAVAVARPAQSRTDRDHARARLADSPVRRRDLHRRPCVHSQRGRGRRQGGRRDGCEEALVCRHPAAAPDRARSGPLRDRVHRRRLRRRLHPHAWRAVQLDAGVAYLGLLHRHRRWLPRRGRGDLAVPVPAARGRQRGDADLRTQGAGELMTWRQKSVTYAVVVPFAIVLAFPFSFALVTMFKTNLDLANVEHSPYLYNDLEGGFHWDFWNYATTEHVTFLFRETNYPTWLLNTLLVGGAVVGITLLLALPAGYALARLAGGWGQSAGVAIFLIYLIPPTLLFLPLSRLITQLDLKDSLWSLILIYPSFTVPFATWLLMGFFKTIPQELEDAALIDGASRLKALFLIILPISLPGILTAVIFAFSLCVNEFIYAFTFISTSEQRTVSAGIPNDLIRGDVFFWQSLMAATLIPAIPLALLYTAFLDRFIKGFTGGAFR